MSYTLDPLPGDAAPSATPQTPGRYTLDPVPPAATAPAGQIDVNAPGHVFGSIPTSGKTEQVLKGFDEAGDKLILGGKQVVNNIRGYLPSWVPGSQTADQTVQNAAQLTAQADQQKQYYAPLNATTPGKVGDTVGSVALTAPVSLIPGGALAQGALIGAVQPTGTGDSRTANVALGAGLGAAGKAVGKVASAYIAPGAGPAVDQEAASLARRQLTAKALAEGRAAGYVVPPTYSNPTVGNSLIERVAGPKGALQAEAANTNQDVTDALAKQALNNGRAALDPTLAPISKDTPLSVPLLQSVRKEAGNAYAALRNAGPINADQQYTKEVQAVADKFKTPSFPGAPPSPLIAEAGNLSVPQFTANDAVTQAGRLRDLASVAARQGDNGTAAGYKQLATSLESAVQRGLAGNPQTASLVPQYQAARTLIAQTRTIEDALTPAGSVDARAIANSGDPVTGELRTISNFASRFPKVATLPDKSGSPPHGGLLAPIIAAKEGVEMAGPAGAAFGAYPLVQPMIRKSLLGRVGQAAAQPSLAPTPVRDKLAAALQAAGNTAPAQAIGAGVNAVRVPAAAVVGSPFTRNAALAAALANIQNNKQQPQ